MSKARLEAFTDAVLAILITIMVLELKVPHSSDKEALRPLVPVFLSYVLSFAYLGIYWNNHHHMLHAADRINGKILWANLHSCSGCPSYPSSQAGWARTMLLRCQPPSTAECCCWRAQRTSFSRPRLLPGKVQIRSSRKQWAMI